MNGNRNLNKKSQDNFNIYIVEDHNDALAEIYKEIGSKRLSFDNLTLIHFDSHPDLGIPSQLNADDVFNRDLLLDSLSIENWILPAVYAGHIRQIVWIKPKWARQIKVGKYEMIIGKQTTDNLLKCNSKEDYFLSDMLYANESYLTNKREFLLYVCDFDSILSSHDHFLLNILSAKDLDRKIILDIDLDFFSTMDPFMRMFKNEHDFEAYKAVYKTTAFFDKDDKDFDSKFAEFTSNKKIKMNQILNLVKKFLNDEEIDADNENSCIIKFGQIVKNNQLDFEILHSYGSCMDDISLPDHISTPKEILFMVDQFNEFLDKYFSNIKPSIVTIARSSLDNYCPPDQVNFIQEEVLKKLKEYFCKQNESLIKNICFNYL